MDRQKFDTFPITLPIKKIIRETPYVKTFVFAYRLGSRPGQFVNLWIPRVDEKPMSIAYDHGDEFGLTVFAVGAMTKRLHEMKPGDRVGVRGPFGRGFEYRSGQHLMMVGGGYGVAPLYFLTREALQKKCSVDFVVGARSKEHLLYTDRVKKMKGVKLHVATDDGSVGVKGYNTLLLEKLIFDMKRTASGRAKLRKCTVFAVGPEVMMKRVSDICTTEKKTGIACQVSVERYMKCGFGVCGNCCIDESGITVCTEGPAMDHRQARKNSDFGYFHRDSVGRKHPY
jgi:dihydroorotate dehydrogenase electron transfer subunit